MLKKITISLFLVFMISFEINAQTLSVDSLKIIAYQDTRKFKLNKADLKTFRKNKNNSTSDYFKPTATYTSNLNFLKDSTYVKAFREAAYIKTKRRKTVAHYVLVGGIVYAIAIAVITIPVAAMH